jgi:hypothetical protein
LLKIEDISAVVAFGAAVAGEHSLAAAGIMANDVHAIIVSSAVAETIF